MPVPDIMIEAPPAIVKPIGIIANKFECAEKRCVDLSTELENVAKEHSTHYFNAGNVMEANVVDGIHLNESQHQILGKDIANAISENTTFS